MNGTYRSSEASVHFNKPMAIDCDAKFSYLHQHFMFTQMQFVHFADIEHESLQICEKILSLQREFNSHCACIYGHLVSRAVSCTNLTSNGVAGLREDGEAGEHIHQTDKRQEHLQRVGPPSHMVECPEYAIHQIDQRMQQQ